MHFLVIRLSSIGDIVHTLPAVAALGETFPGAGIDWAIEPRYAPLLQGNPFVKRVLAFDTLGWRRRLASAVTLEEVARSVFELRELPFDAVIDFQGLVKSALIARLSRARERIGFSEYGLREPLAAAFYTERVPIREGVHVVEESLALVERLGATMPSRERWRFPLPQRAEDDEFVEHQLSRLEAQEFMIINPGGGWTAKRWAPGNYVELIQRLERVLPWRILVTGSPEEEPLMEEIVARARPSRAILFRSTLMQFIALARRAKLFVGGDTGPLHLAAAVGTPIVAIYGPTDPARNGPFSAADIALTNYGPIDHTRRGGDQSYLPGISVEAVLEAVQERRARVHGT
jgi:lipopolysaccharide heptosyltransferase I